MEDFIMFVFILIGVLLIIRITYTFIKEVIILTIKKSKPMRKSKKMQYEIENIKSTLVSRSENVKQFREETYSDIKELKEQMKQAVAKIEMLKSVKDGLCELAKEHSNAIERLKEQNAILQFRVDHPAKFKVGDQVAGYVVTSVEIFEKINRIEINVGAISTNGAVIDKIIVRQYNVTEIATGVLDCFTESELLEMKKKKK